MVLAGSSNYLYDFGNLLSNQFNLNDNKNAVLNTAIDAPDPGTLGAFAGGIDQTAQRSYVEQGFSSVNPFNPTPKQLDILMQTPDITVLVKKRAFASMAENFRPDLMDARDYGFYTATKLLFGNKCKQIASYERICKLARVSMAVGQLSTYLLPTLFSLTDNLTSFSTGIGGGLGSAINSSLNSFSSIVDRVREIVSMSYDNTTTTWISNMQSSFNSTLGLGTGVMELTNIATISTTTALNIGGGSFDLTIEDPYNLMLITHDDIEQAISDYSNIYYNSSAYQLTSSLSSIANQTIVLLKQQLNAMRISRNAYQISFITQPNDFLASPVVVVMPQIGFQINFSGGGLLSTPTIDPSALQGSQQLGTQGLNQIEASLVSQIINQLINQITVSNNAQNQTSIFNKDPIIIYIRKKLRLHYGGKLILQPMDNVHIYIRSYKNIDTKIAAGLQSSFYNGGSFLQSVSNTVEDIASAFNINDNVMLEKSIYVGDDFPTWLWTIFRPWFISNNDGSHVFGGIVEKATSNYNASSGQYSVAIHGQDNSEYFNYGVVNIKPSVDVYNGPIFDPLTPFDIQYDTITGFQTNTTPNLLPENSALLTSAFARFKNGILAGIPVAQDSYLVADAEQPQNLTMRSIFYDPDGMVYRWKEGIATLPGIGDNIQGPGITQAPATTKEPFAGQDIMNVISLLITGEPYNYATYFNAVSHFDSYFARDPSSNEDPSKSYFRTLQNNLKYRNLLYGNFIPFKSLVIDEQTQAKMMYGQLSVQGFNAQLQSLLQTRSTLADRQVQLNNLPTQPNGQANAEGQSAIASINQLDTQIAAAISSISQTLNRINQPITIIGDDVSFNSNSNLATPAMLGSDPGARQDLRRKVALLTRRLSWKVRANEDTNLFIVDDTYDKDLDIQAFAKAITNPEVFISDYETVSKKISDIAKMMDLEVFCNAQGHIEARNPKYNKIPSSVLFQMFQMSNELGIQVFPQFLQDLYVSQIEGLQVEIEVFEDQIRLLGISLGLINDVVVQNLIQNGVVSSGSNGISPIANSTFMFLTDQATGTINRLLPFAQYQANPESFIGAINTALQTVQNQQGISAFTSQVQASIIQAAYSPALQGTANSPNSFSNVQNIRDLASTQTLINTIMMRLQSRTGQTFPLPAISGPKGQPTSGDVLNIVKQISDVIQQRQTVISSFVSALQNTQESLNIDQAGLGSNQPSNPSLNSSTSIPQILEHMIEDESYDDIGPGSHKRYVIENHDIITWGLSEHRPRYTALTVTGRIGQLWLDNTSLPQSLNIYENASAITTTTAVDYDLWRQYGMTFPQHIDAPFLQDPDTQCPVYAVSLLNRARAEVLSGTISIIGNEYQQPGEVIYIRDLDRLYYIESVSHNFTYGAQFITNLTLNYGHAPGEFVPTPLDVIGKMFYKNKDTVNITNKKQETVFNQTHLGVIAGSNSTLDPNTDMLYGLFGVANRATLKGIIDQATGMLLNTSGNFNPVLEIRYYYNSVTQFSPANTYANQIATQVQQYLIGSNAQSGMSNPATDATPNQNNLQSFSSQITVLAVDCSAQQSEFRSPSSKAYYLARSLTQNNSSSTTTGVGQTVQQTAIDTMVYTYIADCWIYFGTTTTNPSGT